MSGPLILFRDHWQDKLQAYKDIGVVVASGVRCPQDGTELWVMEPLKTGLAHNGTSYELRTQVAICENGHSYDL